MRITSSNVALTHLQGRYYWGNCWRTLAGSAVSTADDFSYTDPVDGNVSAGQAIRILLADGSRIVYRLSGTGTEGAMLRLYLEGYRHDGSHPIALILDPPLRAGLDLLQKQARTGRTQATVIT